MLADAWSPGSYAANSAEGAGMISGQPSYSKVFAQELSNMLVSMPAVAMQSFPAHVSLLSMWMHRYSTKSRTSRARTVVTTGSCRTTGVSESLRAVRREIFSSFLSIECQDRFSHASALRLLSNRGTPFPIFAQSYLTSSLPHVREAYSNPSNIDEWNVDPVQSFRTKGATDQLNLDSSVRGRYCVPHRASFS